MKSVNSENSLKSEKLCDLDLLYAPCVCVFVCLFGFFFGGGGAYFNSKKRQYPST